jgi:hypothetical protein
MQVRTPVTLMGGEVAFDPRSQRLCDLLLARTGAVGEKPTFLVAGDEDGLRYGRWHVALEEHSGGERVRRPRGEETRDENCRQDRRPPPQKACLCHPPLSSQSGAKEGAAAPCYVTACSLHSGHRSAHPPNGLIFVLVTILLRLWRRLQTSSGPSAAEEAGPETAVLEGFQFGFEADAVFD